MDGCFFCRKPAAFDCSSEPPDVFETTGYVRQVVVCCDEHSVGWAYREPHEEHDAQSTEDATSHLRSDR